MNLFFGGKAGVVVWLAALATPLQGLPLWGGGCGCGASSNHRVASAAASRVPGECPHCCRPKAETSVPACCRSPKHEPPPCCRTADEATAPVSTCCHGAAVCLCRASQSPAPAVPLPANAPAVKDHCPAAAMAAAPAVVSPRPPALQCAAEEPPSPLAALDRCLALCRFLI